DPAARPAAPGGGRAPAGARRCVVTRPGAGRGGSAAMEGRGRRRRGAAAAAVVLVLGGLLGARARGAAAERLIRYEKDALTVRLTNVPVAEVLDELRRQTGAEVRGQPCTPEAVSGAS